MAAPSVLFIAPSAYPLGGVATWLHYLMPGLAASGWRPILALTDGHWHATGAYPRDLPGCDIETVPNPTGSHEGRLRAVAAAILRTAPALVVGVNIPDSYAAIARLRHDCHAAPRVAMSVHGIQPDLYEDIALFTHVLDGVICTNRLACRLAEPAGMPPARIHYAPYGVPLQSAPPTASQRSDGRLRIAYVGRFENWQKRVSDLPLIVAELARRGVDFELLLAGAGPDEALLRPALALDEAAGRVRFLGNLSPGELEAQVYRQADVLLLTSLWETGPLVVWEAMSHGMVIASSRYVGHGLEGGLRDGENCLLFAIADMAEAASCVMRLQDAALRGQLRAGAHRLLEARYSRQRSVQGWSRALRAVLEAEPLPPAEEPVRVEPAGRLDRWLGTQRGESIRRAAGIRFRHTGPGGEWPHSYGSRRVDDAAFWREASALDSTES